jgi:hypothetical protein
LNIIFNLHQIYACKCRQDYHGDLPYVEWDRFVTITGAQTEWGLRCI